MSYFISIFEIKTTMFVQEENIRSSKDKFKIDAQILEKYLLNSIPILKHHKFKLNYLAENSIQLSAPISENKNHYDTAFGGSISTLGIVTGWALLLYKVKKENLPLRLVIQQNSIHYKKPIFSDFISKAEINTEHWNEFIETSLQKGKAKVMMEIKISSNEVICAEQNCFYAALKTE